MQNGNWTRQTSAAYSERYLAVAVILGERFVNGRRIGVDASDRADDRSDQSDKVQTRTENRSFAFGPKRQVGQSREDHSERDARHRTH